MPRDLQPATGENVAYKAYVRHFQHVGDDDAQAKVLYVIATLTFPDSGWQVLLVPQADEPTVWRLLAEAPGFADGDRTYYVASGSSEHAVDAVPKELKVVDGNETTVVPVESWED